MVAKTLSNTVLLLMAGLRPSTAENNVGRAWQVTR